MKTIYTDRSTWLVYGNSPQMVCTVSLIYNATITQKIYARSCHCILHLSSCLYYYEYSKYLTIGYVVIRYI